MVRLIFGCLESMIVCQCFVQYENLLVNIKNNIHYQNGFPFFEFE